MWRHVDGIREFGSFFTRTTFDNQDLGDRVAMAIHELTENAIKYSHQSDEAELELSVHHDGRVIELSVANTPIDENVPVLRESFERATSGPAETAYLDAMRRAATLPSGQSGLGLARIRQEAQLELELGVEDSLVRVTARGEI
jgi:anti-sigma regulatory factor (Ser/Thr protein kinase)